MLGEVDVKRILEISFFTLTFTLVLTVLNLFGMFGIYRGNYTIWDLPKILQPIYDFGGYLKGMLPILPDSLRIVLTMLIDVLNLIAILQIVRGVRRFF